MILHQVVSYTKYGIQYPFNLHWGVEKYGRVNHNIYRPEKKTGKLRVSNVTSHEQKIRLTLTASQQTPTISTINYTREIMLGRNSGININAETIN